MSSNQVPDRFVVPTSAESCHVMKSTDVDEQEKALKAERLLETYRNWGRFDESHRMAFGMKRSVHKD